MDSQSIGNVTSTAAAAPATGQSRAQSAATTKVERATTTAHHQKAAEQARTQEQIPQRDPRSLQYQVDGATHRVVATIIDDGSKTVVRQIPDAEILRIAQAIDRMQGFLVEEKA